MPIGFGVSGGAITGDHFGCTSRVPTLLSLLVIPVVYSCLDDAVQRTIRRFGRLTHKYVSCYSAD